MSLVVAEVVVVMTTTTVVLVAVAVPLQLNISMFPTSIVYLTNMAVVADMLVMVAEEAVVEHLPLVLTAQRVVEQVDIPITHMKVVEAETLLVVTSIFLVVLVKCHTDQIEKDVVDLHSGTKLDQTTITPVMVQRALTECGVRVVHMDTIHRMVMHTTMATAVLVALSFTNILDMYQTLVNKNTGRIIQFVQGGTEARFDVHEGFMWVDGPYELEPKTTEADYHYNFQDREIQKVEPTPAPYDLARRMEYPDVADQLDMLFHDMETGLVPGKETSAWYATVKSVKESYPKP
jgi:hypothetical protein